MVSESNLLHLPAAFLATAVTAVLVWFGTGLHPLWPLLWVAPLPVLLVAFRSSAWRTTAVAFAAWFIGTLNLWHYVRVVMKDPLPTVLFILAGMALVFTLAVLLFRALVRRGAYWTGLLAFPAVWVSFEYLLSITSPSGTSDNLAYTQLKFLPFLQLASLTGPWGMSFLLLLFPAAVTLGLHLRREAPRRARAVVSVTFGVLALALLFGAIRLALPVRAGTVRVGLVATDHIMANTREAAQALPRLQAFAAQVHALAARGAQVVVIQEKSVGVVDSYQQQAYSILAHAAAANHVTLVAGLNLIQDSDRKRNAALVFSPSGTLLRRYTKHHLIPGMEAHYVVGRHIAVWPGPSSLWGVAICKDMDFPALSRRYGRAGVGLMLVPAWDFVVDAGFHGHMALMRGVESGFSVARSAADGYLTVSDTRGRILAQVRSNSAPFATLVANVPTAHVATLYLLLGNWFAWLVLALLLFSLAQLARFRKKPLA